MAHSASHRRDHHRHDDGATSLEYKDRGHWPRLKFRLEMHFDSHGLQGLIVRGLVNRPEGGFITININPTTMSVITINTGADGTARGINHVGDHGHPQLTQQAGGMEAAAASAPAQLAALTELATQLQSDTNIALQDEAQQEAHRGLTNQLQALQRGIDMPNAQTNTTRDADMEVDVKETNSLADLGGASKQQPTIDKGNQQQEKTTKANQGNANITKKEPDSTSSDEEVDWMPVYKEVRKKAKDQLKRRTKGAADVAWYEKAMKLMKTKKRSKR